MVESVSGGGYAWALNTRDAQASGPWNDRTTFSTIRIGIPLPNMSRLGLEGFLELYPFQQARFYQRLVTLFEQRFQIQVQRPKYLEFALVCLLPH